MASTTAMINSIASFTRAMHISNLCITIFICSLLLPSASLSLTFQVKATDIYIYSNKRNGFPITTVGKERENTNLFFFFFLKIEDIL
uniref:Uncharacterized protein n=1 Tax=Populus trichocarpa TaxID=3694 RepID=U5G3V8_POPTR